MLAKCARVCVCVCVCITGVIEMIFFTKSHGQFRSMSEYSDFMFRIRLHINVARCELRGILSIKCVFDIGKEGQVLLFV